MKTVMLAGCVMLALSVPAFAQKGPVARQCANDIQSYCAGKGHGARQTRSCLETNRDKVSDQCRQALDTTGKGRGQTTQGKSRSGY